MSLVIANFAQSTLTSAISTSDTTIAVSDGSSFPNPSTGDWFPIVLISADTLTKEIVYGTARSGNVITITRARENTTAQTFATGSVASHNLTRDAYNAFPRKGEQSNTIIEGLNYGVAGGTANAITVSVDDIAALADNMMVNLKASITNTSTAVTLNLNGLGARPIVLTNSETSLQVGSIVANKTYWLTYSAGAGGWIINNPTLADATKTVAGKIKLSDVTEETHDVNGDETKAMTQKSVSVLVNDRLNSDISSIFPSHVTYLGGGSDGSQLVPSSTPLEALSFAVNEYEVLNVPNGSTLDASGSNGVVVIRVRVNTLKVGFSSVHVQHRSALRSLSAVRVQLTQLKRTLPMV